MCSGISLSWRELPAALIEQHRLHDREIVRHEGAEREIRFLFRDPHPLIPTWSGHELGIYEWGNRSNKKSRLPRTGWIRMETLEAGDWRWLNPEPVDIPATLGLDRGVWFQIKEGLRGILVRDEKNQPHVYMLTEPASHYYQVMTRNNRMPVFIGATI
jgi:hypothetical protein